MHRASPSPPDWVPRARLERERAARKQAEALLERKARELFDAQKTRQRFVKGVNHEFRTPLNGILGPAQLLQAGSHSAEVREFAKAIEECASQLMELVEAAITGAEFLPPDQQEAEGAPTSPLVLIVDDNGVNRMVARAAVEAIGMRTVQAVNGAEALDLMEEQTPDAILMDVQMPVMDGIQAIKAVRASKGRSRDVPIVVLTANAETGGEERYRKLGADDYMEKPYTIRTLQKTLCRLIDWDDSACC